MTPTNTDVAAKIYAKSVIAAQQPILAKLKEFSIDFSEEAKQPGEDVLVAMVSGDAAAAWNDSSNNFASTPATLGDRKVPIDQRVKSGFAITPAQMANFHPQWWERKGELNAAEIADAILTSVAGLVTADNYGDAAADKLAVSLTGFGRKSITPIRAKAMKDKNLHPSRSVLVLNPEFFSALLGDLDANVYGGREAIEGGVIPGLFGYRAIMELPQLDSPGFVAAPSAICVAGRTIPFLGTAQYDKVQNITEPNTGMVMTNVLYVDGPTGKGSMSVNALFGRAVGDDTALMRLV